MLRWYRELGRPERLTFWVCFGGWSTDAMDAQMFSFLIPALMVAFHLTRGQVGALGTVTLIAAAAGGWVCGLLADRYGRVRVLKGTILWFACFSAVAGLAQSYHGLMLIRILQGLGFGGEWAAGAVLMGEIIRPEHRGKAVGCVQAGYGLGWGMATLLSTLAFRFLPPDAAWRGLLFAGLAPALLVLLIGKRVEEPAVFRATRDAEHARGVRPSPLAIFAPDLRRTTALAALLAFGVVGAGSALNPWLPSLLRSVHGLSVVQLGGYMTVITLGSIGGFIGCAYGSDAIGRRPNLLLFACCSWLITLAYLTLPLGRTALFWLGVPFGFFTVGIYGALGPYFTELFPTAMRGSGQAFAYNFGKSVGACSVVTVGTLAARLGLAPSIGLVSMVCFSLAIIAALLLPETRGRHLVADGVPGGVAPARTLS